MTELEDVLCCPICHGELKKEVPIDTQGKKREGKVGGEEKSRSSHLNCVECGRWFPLFQGIPMMLPDHQMNLKGEELNTMFQNPPGIAQRRTKRMAWYYDTPRKVGGIEEGCREDFGYGDLDGWVLDIGAGDRQALESLERVDQYVSIDVIPRDRPTVVADAHALPFSERTFDGVIARAVLEHVEDEQKVVSEVSRILKPGGLFMFSAPFIYPIHDAVDHHRFTIYSLRSLADRHDFEIMRITSTGGYFGLLAQHVYFGLRMIRDHIDTRFERKPLLRKVLRFFTDLTGMVIYFPFYLLRPLDGVYREMARNVQGRIPFVKGYGGVFRKRE